MQAIERLPATPADAGKEKPTSWWRVPMVWLVIGGPLTVVVASLATAVIAVRGADPVLGPGERGSVSERTSTPDAMTPALQARNHAATPKR
ncbi:nitrogen fixation protein FixH [Ideonella sp.]|uniref:nitrogen fixation protein FixH n=1 Tax=Ideonella sp. TaxID=1929293 RepID=UPI002B464CA5|nr:nitrogen fixation protein FixH [Ideonella sp.]HJV70220.1 nitrogen fixation protein FixH [Ideonella sp.]